MVSTVYFMLILLWYCMSLSEICFSVSWISLLLASLILFCMSQIILLLDTCRACHTTKSSFIVDVTNYKLKDNRIFGGE